MNVSTIVRRIVLLALVVSVLSSGSISSNAFAAAGPASARAQTQTQLTQMPESELLNLIATDPKQIDRIVFQNGSDHILVYRSDASDPESVTVNDGGANVIEQAAIKAKVPFEAHSLSHPFNPLTFILRNLFFFLIIGFVIFFIIRSKNAQAAGSQKMMGFGKSKHKKFDGTMQKVTFADVEGQNEPKEELSEVVEFLKNPTKFAKLGAKIVRGVLLVGPPGNGKTLLARAVAGEAGATFFSISGSSFVEMFVGVGAARVRDLFEEAKKHAPAIIFMDEIDAVGRHRGTGMGGGNDEREQTLNQMLVEMDGFEATDNVIVIAATNRADILDPALVRPGRFDRQVLVDKPDFAGRVGILKVHTRGKPLADDIDLEALGRLTPGFSGAELANACNEAAILAARRGRQTISMDEFDEGISRTTLGVARTSRAQVMTEENRKNTAYHEAGHAVVMHSIEGGSAIGKITIMPRSKALGYAQTVSEDELSNHTKEQLEAHIAMALAGRAAQELFLNTTDTGAVNDFEQATSIARQMVTRFGMSKLGPRALSQASSDPFLGRSMATHSEGNGPELANAIDLEIKRIIDEADAKARRILDEKRDNVERLVAVLLDKETVLAAEFRELMAQ